MDSHLSLWLRLVGGLNSFIVSLASYLNKLMPALGINRAIFLVGTGVEPKTRRPVITYAKGLQDLHIDPFGGVFDGTFNCGGILDHLLWWSSVGVHIRRDPHSA